MTTLDRTRTATADGGNPEGLALTGVAHRYAAGRGHAEGLLALDGVELRVGAGEFVSLVGPSGCGKTTLLRIVAGLLQPSHGEALVLGGTAEAARASRTIGLVTQEPGLLPWRTVEANVALTLELAGERADLTDSGELTALLDRVGILPFAGYHPRALSGGMRQRVALARALVHRPRLLLMDEPFGALDELSREQLRLELLQLWEQERVSVLFVTHSIREAVLLSDRVAVMSPRPGRVVAEVAIDLPRPRREAIEETAAFAEHVARIRAALREHA